MADTPAETLFSELRDLTKHWNDFEHPAPSHEAECREIGKKLHALGGFGLMQEAYRDAKGHNRSASVIAAYWDGIGEWRW